ncbi:solute carrier family 15 member 4-like [Anneissia japonica]|uniref:solute carrier family 15 member 4-like n=1 Tax=Anneissia japonica TaxID=1529436 RepID=UPI0014258D3C|nr:solute carrier family 15 member 4-like [Anneissia japonica]
MLRYRETENSPLLERQNSSDVRRRVKIKAACITISSTQMLERVAFYGVSANLVLFLNQEPLHWPADDAVQTTFIFTGLAYMFAIVGGILADSIFGRFVTILGSFIIYILGMVLLTFLGHAAENVENAFVVLCGKNIEWVKMKFNNPGPVTTDATMHGNCRTPVYIAIVLVAIGSAMFRANISPFGGDQVKNESTTVMRAFFNWFYWAINIGAFLALGGVSFLQQNINFFIGFMVPAAALGLSMILFIFGRPVYVIRKPTGSVLANIGRIVAEAFRGRSRRRRHFARQDSNHILSPLAKPSYLDMAKVRYGGSFHDSMVDDVKSLSTIILVFVALIPYWIVYFQMQTTFLLQGLHMRVTVKPLCHHHNRSENTTCLSHKDNFMFPAAWLTVFNVVTVLFMIPLMERIVYPYLDRRGWHISLLKRINIGMVFVMLAVICAGVLEKYRLQRLRVRGPWLQTIGTTQYYAADMWIFWQIPQYTLIGISEVFASVAGLEFAYSQAPKSMHSLIMGLFYFSGGLGNIFGELLYSFTNEVFNWKSTKDTANINYAKLSYYFFLLAGIQFLTIVIFSLVSRAYEAKEKKEKQGPIAIQRSVTPPMD